ncbi:MAG: hypothetical protein ACOY3P_18365 [Planctomycetota bacterium]
MLQRVRTFQLHDRSRRLIGLLGFFVLCLLPTAATLAWCATAQWPGRAASEARRLGRALRLRVALNSVEDLRPGARRYGGLALADPETAQPLLRAAVLEQIWSGRTHAGRPVLLLRAPNVEVAAAGVERLWPLIDRELKAESGSDIDVRWEVGSLRIVDAAQNATLVEVRGLMEEMRDGAQAQTEFRVPDVGMSQPARVRLVRNRQTTPPQTGVEMDTAGASLPCGLLAMAWPELRPLGWQSCFRGYVWANDGVAGPSGEVIGQLTDVPLGRLLSGSGTDVDAAITIHTIRFRDGRVDEAAATLSAGPGMMPRSFLENAAERLKLVPRGRLPDGLQAVPFEQLALGAWIDQRGLHLQGRCAGGEPGVILIDRLGGALVEPILQPQPVAALVQAISPPAPTMIPASEEVEPLARWLPLSRGAVEPAPAEVSQTSPVSVNR